MVWFAKHKRSHQQIEREALAASVEELARDEIFSGDKWADEDEDKEASAARTGGAILIPPLLHLQSRPLPAVHADATKQITVKRELGQEARMLDAGAPIALSGKRLGRSTKVHLQAVRPGQVRTPITERVPIVEPSEPRADAHVEPSTHNGQAIARRIEPPVAPSPTFSPSSLFCGSGIIEEGQGDATVHNPRISAQSVITVMLAGNPGPVVVHYISLQPRAGFTLHMSAPVSTTIPFNYAVWLF